MASLDLPVNNTQAADYAIDLNGDGHADNAFGNVLSMLGSAGLDIPGATSAAMASGQVVHLVELRSDDNAFANDATAEAFWYVGKATAAAPLFDGTDTFEYDPAFAPGNFAAALSGGGFVSAAPATTTVPVDITVELRIGNHEVPVPLQGARLKFSAAGANLSQGQVNGSIRETDVYTIVIPAVAVAFNDMVQNDPLSATAQSVLSLFDTNPKDGVISVDELATNPLIQTIIAPDVQIRDQNGDYAPNPANTSPDALSFGCAFLAIQSSTVLPPIFANGFEN